MAREACCSAQRDSLAPPSSSCRGKGRDAVGVVAARGRARVRGHSPPSRRGEQRRDRDRYRDRHRDRESSRGRHSTAMAPQPVDPDPDSDSDLDEIKGSSGNCVLQVRTGERPSRLSWTPPDWSRRGHRSDGSPIPRGLRPPAQGCGLAATLGPGPIPPIQPQGGCVAVPLRRLLAG